MSLEVILLGTSSATPTLRRGLSSVVILRDGEVILLDCGEGTQARLLKAGMKRRKFHRILISHLHGDHVFGLGGLLYSLNLSDRTEPLDIHGPAGLKRLVDFFLSFPRPARFSYPIRVFELPPDFTGTVVEESGYRILARPLVHTVPTLGYRFEERDRPGRFDSDEADRLGVPFGPERGVLQHGGTVTLPGGRVVRPSDLVGPPRRGRVIAYCTDTAFCAAARQLAGGADVLIHEATYGDDLAEMARDRGHSTIRQAATVARDAGARLFIATHFSTRYENEVLAALEAEGREVFADLIMGRDLMRIEVREP